MDVNDIVDRTINIEMCCRRLGVEEVMLVNWSILVKWTLNLSKIIWQENDLLSEMCIVSNIDYVCNNNVTWDHLWKNRIHFAKADTDLLTENFITFFNNFVWSKSGNNWLT